MKPLTEREQELVALYKEIGVGTQVARKMGISDRRFYQLQASIRDKGHILPRDRVDERVPFDHQVSGTSFLVDADGNKVMQWVKTKQADLDREQFHTYLENKHFGKAPKFQARKGKNSDKMAVFPIGDPHLGMFSWPEETGQDYDLAKGIELHYRSFVYLLEKAIKCEGELDQILIAPLGDVFHSDNRQNVTEKSGHRLDVDSRYWKVVDGVTRLLTDMIEYAAVRSKKTLLVIPPGNHDWHSSGHVCRTLDALYSKSGHIHVDIQPTKQKYIRYGQTLIGLCHRDTEKPKNLPQLMWTDKRSDAGETLYHIWYTGHIHHQTVYEDTSAVIESFNTLAAMDAYAYEHGYRSRRQMTCIVHDKEYGEIARYPVRAEHKTLLLKMVKDIV